METLVRWCAIVFDFLSVHVRIGRLTIFVPLAAAVVVLVCDAVYVVNDAVGKKATYIFSCRIRRSSFLSACILYYRLLHIY